MDEQEKIDYEAEEARLIAAGILKPPQRKGGIDWEAVSKLPMPEVSEEAMREAIAWAKGNTVDAMIDRIISEKERNQNNSSEKR